MVIFAHPHQDPSSAVLNVLQLLKVFVRDPDKERIAVVQSGGDKGVSPLMSRTRKSFDYSERFWAKKQTTQDERNEWGIDYNQKDWSK